MRSFHIYFLINLCDIMFISIVYFVTSYKMTLSGKSFKDLFSLRTGASCSKLTTSLVNVLLKFKT